MNFGRTLTEKVAIHYRACYLIERNALLSASVQSVQGELIDSGNARHVRLFLVFGLCVDNAIKVLHRNIDVISKSINYRIKALRHGNFATCIVEQNVRNFYGLYLAHFALFRIVHVFGIRVARKIKGLVVIFAELGSTDRNDQILLLALVSFIYAILMPVISPTDHVPLIVGRSLDCKGV